MRREGYRSQRELGTGEAEIGVAIGRGGEPLRFRKGGHRLALARLLELRRITVSVRFAHPDWVRGLMRRFGSRPADAVAAGLAAARGAASGIADG